MASKLSTGLPRLAVQDQKDFNLLAPKRDANPTTDRETLAFVIETSRIDYLATYTLEHVLEVAQKGRR